MMAEREERAGGDVVDVIDWFCRQDDRWSPSTVRQYRAAILHELETTRLFPTVRAQLEMWLHKGPAPREKGPKRTSARKRKSLPIAQFTRLDRFLKSSGRDDDWLIRCFMGFGVALFPRPSEYLGAWIEGTSLFIRNAKATNGRANGEHRERDIADMGPRAISALRKFLHKLKEAVAAAGSWKKLHDRLASRLARVCKTLGIPRVSLYTLRHVGMATAKTWMTPAQVAAASGHASIRTATSHYAKRRTGWVGLKMAGRPSPESVAQVRGTLKLFEPKTSAPRLEPMQLH
ncbi:hypothetical protein [Pelagibacterium mangrovi]|uniref:hypothetical protein n=1 Tax=Pelagibacterium mangrovi TaxID=3119828 RepID=UPI002FC77059